jgi:hypothetical protein
MAFRPEATLNPRALRRETIQLGVVAVASLAALVTGVTILQVIAGVLDVLAAALTAVAAIVAWRVGGRGPALGLYVVAAVVFVGLAFANLAT